MAARYSFRRLTSSGLGVPVLMDDKSTFDEETLDKALRMAAFCAADVSNGGCGSGVEQEDMSASDASDEGSRSEALSLSDTVILGVGFGESTISMTPAGEGDRFGLPGGRLGGPMYGVGNNAATVSLAGFLGGAKC